MNSGDIFKETRKEEGARDYLKVFEVLETSVIFWPLGSFVTSTSSGGLSLSLFSDHVLDLSSTLHSKGGKLTPSVSIYRASNMYSRHGRDKNRQDTRIDESPAVRELPNTQISKKHPKRYFSRV